MSGINHWSITLSGRRSRRPRWLTANGHLSSNPAQALRLVCPEVAAQRVQDYLRLWGRPIELIERFRLVPSPPLPCSDRNSSLPLSVSLLGSIVRSVCAD
ncbi:MAG: hypothetical protein VKJ44_05550 [Synechococcus sp.]|nr:hypothetical protein [Synechococcus sp.]